MMSEQVWTQRLFLVVFLLCFSLYSSAPYPSLFVFGRNGIVSDALSNSSFDASLIGATSESRLFGLLPPENSNPDFKLLRFLYADSISCQGPSAAAVVEETKVVSWGKSWSSGRGFDENEDLDLPPALVMDFGSPIVKITSGSSLTFVLLSNGSLYFYGTTNSSRLGNLPELSKQNLTGLFGANSSRPVRLPNSLFDDELVRDIHCGEYSCSAVTNQGSIFSWGSNERGTLGLRRLIPALLPVRVDTENVTSASFVSITGRGGYMAALTDSGRVACWGLNATNCGFLSWSIGPQLVQGDHDSFIKIQAGRGFMLGLSDTNKVYIWGSISLFGVDLPSKPQLLPLPSSIERVIDIAANPATSFILTDKYQLWSVGRNEQLEPSSSPLQLQLVFLPPKFQLKSLNTQSSSFLQYFIAKIGDPTGCVGRDEPGKYFACVDGKWVLSGLSNLELSGNQTLKFSEPVEIFGNFSFNGKARISRALDFLNIPVMNFTDFPDLDEGEIIIELTAEDIALIENSSNNNNGNSPSTNAPNSYMEPSFEQDQTVKVLIAEYPSGRTMGTTKITVTSTSPTECKQIEPTTSEESSEDGTRTQLSVIFAVDSSNCSEKKTQSSNTWKIVVGSTLGAVVAIVIVFALLATFHPAVKAAVRPFWVRKMHARVTKI